MTIEELYEKLSIQRPACTTVTIMLNGTTLPIEEYIRRIRGLGFVYEEICVMVQSLRQRCFITIQETTFPDIENLIDRVESILIEEGQHDLQFKLGEIIKYDPHAVKLLLLKHADELKNSL